MSAYTLLVILLLQLATTAPSATTQPGKVADDNYATATARAKAQYTSVLASAAQEHVRNLKSAMVAALAARNLDEANRIADEIKALQPPSTAPTTRPDQSSTSQPVAGTTPKGPPLTAPEADAEYLRARTQAKRIYDEAMASAKRTYIKSLSTALDEACSKADLDEATRISTELKGLKAPELAPTEGISPAAKSSPPEPTAQRAGTPSLPDDVTAALVEQANGRLRLTLALAGSKWAGMLGNGVTVTLNTDGTGISSEGHAMHWAAVSDTQIIVFWENGNTDLWTFDPSLRSGQKRWAGNRLAIKNQKGPSSGTRVE